ncbi:MAG: HAD family hydrolase [Candidatus Bathyarchaeota archaeon]|nr:HAD family hydrolase [Candidatus Bathyarchaeota archaeon]
MAVIRAVIFDFIGTLTDLVGYSLENSENKMFRSLIASGFDLGRKEFFEAYERAHHEYWNIRYGQLKEITNAVWISEALNHLGYAITADDKRIKTAVNAFFENYLKALKLRVHAKKTLQRLSQEYQLGLISNYTYAPLIYAGLRKLKINEFFNVVVVSDEAGWRKPSPKIFREALRRLRLKVDQVLYVGDTPLEDIEGAKKAGVKTVFIPSQFNSLEDMQKAPLQPDHVIEKLSDIFKILDKQ